ncbi:MAG: hypothetical protein RLZZ299_2953 [Pseudomonadota bacterium]
MLTILALVARAYGATPVVHADDDPAALLARVAAATKMPITELRAVTIPELADKGIPALLGGGTLTRCTVEAPNRAAIEASLEVAKGSFLYMEYGSARAVLDAAIRGLGCLKEPVDRALAARAWFLLGVVAHASADISGSRAAFRQARLFQPILPWDPNYPPAARETFDAVVAEMKATAPIPIAVVPEPPNGTLRFDGWPVKVVDGKVAVAPGTHHVQVWSQALTTVTVDVKASSTLVLPQFASDEELGWAGDGERRPALSAILAGAAGGSEDVYVVSGDILWRVQPGRGAWDIVGTGMAAAAPKAEVGAAPPTPAAPAQRATTQAKPTPPRAAAPTATGSGATPAPTTHRSRYLPAALTTVGGGMLLGAAAINFLVIEPAWQEAEAANANPGSLTREEALSLANRYDTATYGTLALLVAGIPTFATGLGMTFLDAAFVVSPDRVGIVGRW